jgi:hypothetical protein
MPLISASLSLAVAFAGGCPAQDSSRGERTDGECPDGESCSDLAAHGLRFYGAPLGDSTDLAATTATGGVQTFSLYRVEEDETETPLEIDFEATTCPADNSPCTPDRASVASVSGNKVTLAAAADGCTDDEYVCAATLRVLEAGSNRLLDRTTVNVAAVASMSLWSPREELSGPFSLLAGQAASIQVHLFSPAGPEGGADRLVDESMDVEVLGDVNLQRPQWDRLEILAADPQELTLDVRAGTAEQSYDLPVIAEVESIEGGTDPIALRKGETLVVCFRAFDGDDRLVLGAEWTAEAHGPVSVAGSGRDNPRCFELTGDDEGGASIQVEASGASALFDVEVAAAAAE